MEQGKAVIGSYRRVVGCLFRERLACLCFDGSFNSGTSNTSNCAALGRRVPSYIFGESLQTSVKHGGGSVMVQAAVERVVFAKTSKCSSHLKPSKAPDWE